MAEDPFDRRPFVDWRIDAAKLLVIFALFCLILIGALMWPVG